MKIKINVELCLLTRRRRVSPPRLLPCMKGKDSLTDDNPNAPCRDAGINVNPSIPRRIWIAARSTHRRTQTFTVSLAPLHDVSSLYLSFLSLRLV